MNLKNKYQKFSKITELKFRRHLADECERQAPLYGIVELNEPYFGAKRIRGRRGYGAGGKTIVFGILKRGGRFIPGLFPMRPKQCCRRSLEVVSVSEVPSIPTVGSVIRDWLTWVLPDISGVIMVAVSLSVVRGILTVLNLFKAAPSIAWCNLTGAGTYVLPAFKRNRGPLQSQA